MKLESRELLTIIGKTLAEKDVQKCINSFVNKIVQNKDFKRIEELSEIAQNFFQSFGKRMDNSPNYAGKYSHSIVILKKIFVLFVSYLSYSYFIATSRNC